MTRCPNRDCGYCVGHADNKYANTDGNGGCLGYNKCKWYERWKNGVEKRQEILMKVDDCSCEEAPTATVTKDAQWRKERPLFSGCLRYFPDALMEVANCSYVGNEQHNPGQPLHWNRSKSGDELDAMMRHMKDIDGVDDDGVSHAAKVAWRALAYLQKKIEKEQAQ